MLLYRFLISLLAPVLAAAMLVRTLRGRESWSDFRERLGLWQQQSKTKTIWIHGASNGELTAARTLIEAIAARRPDADLLITCNTTTAKAMVRAWSLPRTAVYLAPLDLRWIYARIIKQRDVQQFILIEADFWPSRILAAQGLGVPMALVAGRMSQNSAKGWARFSNLSNQVFSAFKVISTQDEAAKARLIALGANPDAFTAPMALKSHYSSTAQPKDHSARQGLWLAASTHDGEDETLLRAHQMARQALPDLRLILAPRHPKRATDIADCARALGLKVSLRSSGAQLNRATDVYIADTLGEMELWYQQAGVCFVAGSLAAKGGHTPYEPAFHACAILHGPHLDNFSQEYQALSAQAGALLCETPKDIAAALVSLQDRASAEKLRDNARRALAVKSDLTALLDKLAPLAKT